MDLAHEARRSDARAAWPAVANPAGTDAEVIVVVRHEATINRRDLAAIAIIQSSRPGVERRAPAQIGRSAPHGNGARSLENKQETTPSDSRPFCSAGERSRKSMCRQEVTTKGSEAGIRFIWPPFSFRIPANARPISRAKNLWSGGAGQAVDPDYSPRYKAD